MYNNPEESPLKYVGERFEELRATLYRDSGEKWSQTKLATHLDLTQNIIYRLEQGSGSLENLVQVMLFFHAKGFDLFWMIAPDNTSLPKYRQIKGQPQGNPEIIQTLEKLNNLILGKSVS